MQARREQVVGANLNQVPERLLRQVGNDERIKTDPANLVVRTVLRKKDKLTVTWHVESTASAVRPGVRFFDSPLTGHHGQP